MAVVGPTGLTTDLRVKCLARLVNRAATGQSDMTQLLNVIIGAVGASLDIPLLNTEAALMKADLTAQISAATSVQTNVTTELSALTNAIG